MPIKPVWLMLLVLCGLITTPVAAHPGNGLVVNSKGCVYFVDIGRRAVWKICPGGELKMVASQVWCHRLVIDRHDRIYIEDEDYRAGQRVVTYWRLDDQDQLTQMVPPIVSPGVKTLDDFHNGYGILYDDHGNSYGLAYGESDDVVQFLGRVPGTPEGDQKTIHAQLTEADGKTPASFKTIEAISWGSDGSVLLTEGSRVRRILPDGRVEVLGGDPLAGKGDRGHYRVLGVTQGTGDEIFVADSGAKRVRRIDNDGTVTDVYRGYGTWVPLGVATHDDALYVLLNRVPFFWPWSRKLAGPKVVRIDADGNVQHVAFVPGQDAIWFGLILLLALGLAVLLTRRLVKFFKKQKLRKQSPLDST